MAHRTLARLHFAAFCGLLTAIVALASRSLAGGRAAKRRSASCFVDVVKQIAAEKHVPLIDLHARSIELY